MGLFQCYQCKYSSKFKRNLRRHIEKIHLHSRNKIVNAVNLFTCPICKIEVTMRKDIITHYIVSHGACLSTERHQFSSFNNFIHWKEEIEKKGSSRFVKVRGSRKVKSGFCVVYFCHREGFFHGKGNGKRHLKAKGTNKINSCCPAEMKVKVNHSGTVSVDFISTHFGHEIELSRLHLSDTDKKSIAEKLSQNVPFDIILDHIRESVTDHKLERIHLVTKQDLANIAREYSLPKPNIVKQKTDCDIIHEFVTKMQCGANIRMYKRKTFLLNEYPELLKNDFVLIIASDAQLEIVKQYAPDCVCFDRVCRYQFNDFEIITLLVIDESEKGFPGALMITNRVDAVVVGIFTITLHKLVGGIATKFFFSESNNLFFDGWCSTMPPPVCRLYSNWDVDYEWRTNLNKIKDIKKRKYVYNKLKAILQEDDKLTFTHRLDDIMNEFCNDQDLKLFGVYFSNTYGTTTTYWASCYQKHFISDVRIYLESIHNSINAFCSSENTVNNVGMAVSLFIKCIDVEFSKGAIHLNRGDMSKLSVIMDTHRSSLEMSEVEIVKAAVGWKIHVTPGRKPFEIVENCEPCECILKCDDCGICIHKFKCSCFGSSIRWNMCTHIHYLATHIKAFPISTSQHENHPESDHQNSENLSICEVEQNIQEHFVVLQLPHLNNELDITNMEERFVKLKSCVEDIFMAIETPSDMAIVENHFANILPELEASKQSSQSNPPDLCNGP